MFCYQCEQTAHGTACVTTGLCGKDGDTAALQDLLVYAAQGISQYAHRAAALGARSADIDHFVADALFTTVTNVSFDPARLEGQIRQAVAIRDKAAVLYAEAARAAGQEPEKLSGPAAWVPAADLVAQGQEVTIQGRIASEGADITGLKEMLVYGVKGAAAYACHARVLGQEDPVVYAFFHEALDVALREGLTAEDLLGLNLRCGEISLRVMELLDAANTGTYGHPVPTPVLMGHKKGKAILVSGHDLKDLEELLKQTEGKGINIYTHGEMLPAHGYPNLKKYPHLAGHFGGAWQKQRQEFRDFPGSILMTTNCIQNPHEDYAGRLFTSGLVAWPGIPHIANHDYTPVINAALAAEGFQDDSAEKFHTVGFGHNAVLGVADVVIDAVKSGALKRFMLIGGCDGS
ncbi:MAG TPA: hydroxylamine reductase, partial [Azospirillaceae bacterium]|nr:hydroxylamine reductase [Azospirillaceae bacterium]